MRFELVMRTIAVVLLVIALLLNALTEDSTALISATGLGVLLLLLDRKPR